MLFKFVPAFFKIIPTYYNNKKRILQKETGSKQLKRFCNWHLKKKLTFPSCLLCHLYMIAF